MTKRATPEPTQTPPSSQQPSEPRGSLTDLLRRADTVTSVLVLLFCFTAACGLPFLWVSRAFRWPGKVVVSIIVTLYTLALFWVFYVIMVWAWQRIAESL